MCVGGKEIYVVLVGFFSILLSANWAHSKTGRKATPSLSGRLYQGRPQNGLNGRVWRLGSFDATAVQIVLAAISGGYDRRRRGRRTLLQIGLLLRLQLVSDGGRGLLRLLGGIDMLIAIIATIQFLIVVHFRMDLCLRIGTDIRVQSGACKTTTTRTNI